ncbi:Transcriptional regulator [Cystobacter fuscus DSM 2262]|uniref:Transcriptional regulator n=1 Tax=Cystobacter fuscus (strain ATCC 25194 / DSM 2262 / NBRC 100088 / M29) TaxID=1242864 RepID=S9QFN7_CYSF2|nr:LysR family transcriptional regulator [Cystobacter fuscus]EPX55158.1 Transcriptional regulator [Cystobacter fuscus DSM 2262]
MIQLQRLEGFYWVARCEGYARAARAFPYPITQPGVHQQVRRLEAELGVRLFERIGKDRVVLTPQGRILYDAIAPFYEALPALERSLRSGEIGGRLRIHASGHVLRHLLPPWLRRLRGQRPDIEVALFEAKTPAVAALRSGEAELLVDHLPEVPSDLEARQVGKTRAFLVVPSIPRPQLKGPVTPVPWRDEPFIAYSSDTYLRELQLAALAHFGVVPRRIYAADSAETILGFVAAGLGYSLLASVEPRGPRVPGVTALPLTEPARQFPLYVAWRRTPQPNPLIAALLALAPSS